MSRPAVTDATSRLEIRRRSERLRRLRQVSVVALFVLLVTAVVWVIGFSPAFAVRRIDVSGTKVLRSAEVLDAAAVALGTPLVWVDPAAIADRVAGLPVVDAVTVARTWPDGVSIVVVERKARLAVSDGEGFLLADAAGIVFQAVDQAPAGVVPVEADPGDRQALIDVGTVYSALSPATAAKVSSIRVRSRDAIVIRLKDGSRINWGSAQDSALKSTVVDELLALGGTEFDVSAPSHPSRRIP